MKTKNQFKWFRPSGAGERERNIFMFTSRKMAIMVFGVLGFALCLSQVQAEVITIGITGEVTDGDGSLWGGSIHVGSIFTGTYSYDTSAPNLSQPPHWGGYLYDSPYGLKLTLGGYEFKTAITHIGKFMVIIIDNSPTNPTDTFKIQSDQNELLSNGLSVDYFQWSLFDGSQTAISSVDLPCDAPDLTRWPFNTVSIWGGGYANHYSIMGRVTEAYRVPEPLTSLLLITGVLFTGRWKRNSMNKPPQLPAATA